MNWENGQVSKMIYTGGGGDGDEDMVGTGGWGMLGISPSFVYAVCLNNERDREQGHCF